MWPVKPRVQQPEKIEYTLLNMQAIPTSARMIKRDAAESFIASAKPSSVITSIINSSASKLGVHTSHIAGGAPSPSSYFEAHQTMNNYNALVAANEKHVALLKAAAWKAEKPRPCTTDGQTMESPLRQRVIQETTQGVNTPSCLPFLMGGVPVQRPTTKNSRSSSSSSKKKNNLIVTSEVCNQSPSQHQPKVSVPPLSIPAQQHQYSVSAARNASINPPPSRGLHTSQTARSTAPPRTSSPRPRFVGAGGGGIHRQPLGNVHYSLFISHPEPTISEQQQQAMGWTSSDAQQQIHHHCSQDCKTCNKISKDLDRFERHLQKLEREALDKKERQKQRERLEESFINGAPASGADTPGGSSNAGSVRDMPRSGGGRKLSQHHGGHRGSNNFSLNPREPTATVAATVNILNSPSIEAGGNVNLLPLPPPTSSKQYLNLLHAVSENPITGLLVTIPLPKIYDCFVTNFIPKVEEVDILRGKSAVFKAVSQHNFVKGKTGGGGGNHPAPKKQTLDVNPSTATMTLEQFSEWLHLLIPDVTLSDDYVKKMFSPFVRDQSAIIKKILFVDVFHYLAHCNGDPNIEKNVQIFFDNFVDVQTKMLPTAALQGNVVLSWAENRVIGEAIYNWRLVSKAFEIYPPPLTSMQQAAPVGVGTLTLKELRTFVCASAGLSNAFCKNLDCVLTDTPRFPPQRPSTHLLPISLRSGTQLSQQHENRK